MKMLKIILISVTVLLMAALMTTAVFAESEAPEPTEASAVSADGENTVRDYKAISAAVIIGIVAASGAIAMALTIMKTIDGIARQPEASGNIRGAMMLGLVFIETAIIYALIVAILVVFVL